MKTAIAGYNMTETSLTLKFEDGTKDSVTIPFEVGNRWCGLPFITFDELDLIFTTYKTDPNTPAKTINKHL